MIATKRLFFVIAFIVLTIPFSVLASKAAVAITHLEQTESRTQK